jgi:hypothetical protein
MNRDSYIRAYMAGALLPVWVLLAVLGFYLLGHVTGRMPAGLERALMFPMAVVPNVWGLWNVLFFRLHCRRFVSIGVFGATLPLLLFPAGLALASALDLNIYTVDLYCGARGDSSAFCDGHLLSCLEVRCGFS